MWHTHSALTLLRSDGPVFLHNLAQIGVYITHPQDDFVLEIAFLLQGCNVIYYSQWQICILSNDKTIALPFTWCDLVLICALFTDGIVSYILVILPLCHQTHSVLYFVFFAILWKYNSFLYFTLGEALCSALLYALLYSTLAHLCLCIRYLYVLHGLTWMLPPASPHQALVAFVQIAREWHSFLLHFLHIHLPVEKPSPHISTIPPYSLCDKKFTALLILF